MQNMKLHHKIQKLLNNKQRKTIVTAQLVIKFRKNVHKI